MRLAWPQAVTNGDNNFTPTFFFPLLNNVGIVVVALIRLTFLLLQRI